MTIKYKYVLVFGFRWPVTRVLGSILCQSWMPTGSHWTADLFQDHNWAIEVTRKRGKKELRPWQKETELGLPLLQMEAGAGWLWLAVSLLPSVLGQSPGRWDFLLDFLRWSGLSFLLSLLRSISEPLIVKISVYMYRVCVCVCVCISFAWIFFSLRGMWFSNTWKSWIVVSSIISGTYTWNVRTFLD